MDLSKVKLVVTDMDGTLLNSKDRVNPQFFKLFKQLQELNIHFVAASGRQFSSISNKLDSIKNDISIIAENGAYGKHDDVTFVNTTLSKNKIKSIIQLIRPIKNTNICLCGKDTAYIETKDPKFINMFSEYYVSYNIVEDLTKIDDVEFLKIAVYHSESSEKHLYPIAKPFEENMQIKVSGQHWLDFSESNANKGYALKLLQEKLGVTKAETMAFGDYNNDLEMLKRAHFSYAMQNAHPNVKRVANFETKSNDNAGVEFILEQLIKAKQSL